MTAWTGKEGGGGEGRYLNMLEQLSYHHLLDASFFFRLCHLQSHPLGGGEGEGEGETVSRLCAVLHNYIH